jgi:hypothetical protein
MILSKTKDMENLENRNWKGNGQKYLKELQAFLDKAENIKDEELRKEVIFQMLKCDNELTILAEDMLKKYQLNQEKSLIDCEEDD